MGMPHDFQMPAETGGQVLPMPRGDNHDQPFLPEAQQHRQKSEDCWVGGGQVGTKVKSPVK